MNQKQLFLLLGTLTLGWAANAQSSATDRTSDTTHIMHHRFHRPGQNRFQHDSRAFGRTRFGHRETIHYTPEQRHQVEAINKDYRQKKQDLFTLQLATRRKRSDENRQVMAAARLERLRLNLNLTDDQVAQIKAGQHNLRNQVQAIHENGNLLPQEKREQMHTLMMSRNDNLKTILTPDQYTKFQQMSHHRHGGAWQGRGGFSGRTV